MLKTLKGKISLVYIGLVLLIALVGGVSVFNFLLLQKSVNGLMAENYISISAMESAQKALNEQNIAILQYLELNNETGINRFAENNNLFQKPYLREKYNVTEPGEQAIVDSINNDYSEWTREFAVFLNVRDLCGKAESSHYYKSTMEPQYRKMRRTLQNHRHQPGCDATQKKFGRGHRAELPVYHLFSFPFRRYRRLFPFQIPCQSLFAAHPSADRKHQSGERRPAGQKTRYQDRR